MRNILENSLKTNKKDKVIFNLKMEMFTKDRLRMIWSKVKELWPMLMDQFTLDAFKMALEMEKGST